MTQPTPPRRAAVLGHPIAHSLSPVLHRTAYEVLGLPWQYDAVDVDVDALPDFMAGLGSEWAGLSLTMPLKEAVLPLLDTVDPLAHQLRSVNTVVFTDEDEDGRPGRAGYNTDVHGIVETIRGHLLIDQASSSASRALIIGGGATARSAVAALAQLQVETVIVCARRSQIAGAVAALATDLGSVGETAAWPPSQRTLAEPLVVSTIPAAAGGAFAGDLPLTPGALLDVLYDPWPTPLAAAWMAGGGVAVGGLDLLVHQATEQVRLMTGQVVEPSILRAAGLAALSRRNIAQAEQ